MQKYKSICPLILVFSNIKVIDRECKEGCYSDDKQYVDDLVEVIHRTLKGSLIDEYQHWQDEEEHKLYTAYYYFEFRDLTVS